MSHLKSFSFNCAVCVIVVGFSKSVEFFILSSKYSGMMLQRILFFKVFYIFLFVSMCIKHTICKIVVSYELGCD